MFNITFRGGHQGTFEGNLSSHRNYTSTRTFAQPARTHARTHTPHIPSVFLHTVGDGNDEVLGHFTIKGNYSEKAPYPVEFTIHFVGTDARMEFNGWREGDKGKVPTLLWY